MSPRPMFVNGKTKGNALPDIPFHDGRSVVGFRALREILPRIVWRNLRFSSGKRRSHFHPRPPENPPQPGGLPLLKARAPAEVSWACPSG